MILVIKSQSVMEESLVVSLKLCGLGHRTTRSSCKRWKSPARTTSAVAQNLIHCRLITEDAKIPTSYQLDSLCTWNAGYCDRWSWRPSVNLVGRLCKSGWTDRRPVWDKGSWEATEHWHLTVVLIFPQIQCEWQSTLPQINLLVGFREKNNITK